LAKEGASSNRTGGFAYTLDLSGLSVFNLHDSESSIMGCLALLVNNRLFSTASPLAAEAYDYMSAHFLPNIKTYNAVSGDFVRFTLTGADSPPPAVAYTPQMLMRP